VTGLVRESWILTGFVVLAVAAVAISAAGWILFVRDRRQRRAAGAGGAADANPGPA
jgi:hypothetical protein